MSQVSNLAWWQLISLIIKENREKEREREGEVEREIIGTRDSRERG